MARPGRKPSPMGVTVKDVKREWVDLAKKRTEFLTHPSHLTTMNLRTMLANAWMQGLWDATETMQNRWPDRITAPAVEGAPEGLA